MFSIMDSIRTGWNQTKHIVKKAGKGALIGGAVAGSIGALAGGLIGGPAGAAFVGQHMLKRERSWELLPEWVGHYMTFIKVTYSI